MQQKLISFFIGSSGALLLAVGTAMVICIPAGPTVVLIQDPIFPFSSRIVYWIFAGLVFSVALVCLFSQNKSLKATLILWITLNMAVYVLGIQWNGQNGDLNNYLIRYADAFGVTRGAAFWMIKVTFFYFLVGGLITSLWIWREGSKGYLKIVCAHCGGHIAFLAQALGQQIDCPHCRTAITLFKPDENLKMTCVLCGEHVEFPAHALGQKIPCPHCAKTITLLKPV